MKNKPLMIAQKDEELGLLGIGYFKSPKHFYKNKPYWSIYLDKSDNYSNFKDQLEYFIKHIDESNNHILVPCSCLGACGIIRFSSYVDGNGIIIYVDYYTQRKLNPKHLTIQIHPMQLEYILEKLN